MKKRTLCMCFAVVLFLASCLRNLDHDAFYIDSWEGYGRILCTECPDYCRVAPGVSLDTLKRIMCEIDNWEVEGFPQSKEKNACWIGEYAYQWHRPSGEIETLYGMKSIGLLWYIHRVCTLDKWLIVENKTPGKILGYRYLQNPNNRKKDPRYFNLEHYSFEGQKKLFDSKQSDFWIVNRKWPDIYGPYTEQQVVAQMKKLQIPLPVTLKGKVDWYERCRDVDGCPIPIPRKLLWAKRREDKVLGEKGHK